MLFSDLSGGGVIGLAINMACGIGLIVHALTSRSEDRSRKISLCGGAILLIGSLLAALMFASS